MEATIAAALQASLDNSSAGYSTAYETLRSLEANASFSTALLTVTAAAAADANTRQAASLYFKNLVKRAWVSGLHAPCCAALAGGLLLTRTLTPPHAPPPP